MTIRPEILTATVFHGRTGKTNNSFTYRADYLSYPVSDLQANLPALFSRNKLNLWSLNDSDIGQGKTSPKTYSKDLIRACGIPAFATQKISLITLPNSLGFNFNPISFWLFFDNSNELRAAVLEVTNVGRDRHSYLCKVNDFAPISSSTKITAAKILHVSPFQNQDGEYSFKFDIKDESFSVRIDYASPTEDGLVATLSGQYKPLTNSNILLSAIRLPFGALRIVVLIFWQALKLKIKGARFRHRPAPPAKDITL